MLGHCLSEVEKSLASPPMMQNSLDLMARKRATLSSPPYRVLLYWGSIKKWKLCTISGTLKMPMLPHLLSTPHYYLLVINHYMYILYL